MSPNVLAKLPLGQVFDNVFEQLEYSVKQKFETKYIPDSDKLELSPFSVSELDHAILNLELAAKNKKDFYVQDFIRFQSLLDEIFFKKSIMTCINQDCEKFQKEITKYTKEFVKEEILKKYERGDIIFLGYLVEGSLERLVWEFRESIANGVKRFLIDGRYYQHESGIGFANQEEVIEGGFKVTAEERKLLSKIKSFVVIDSTCTLFENKDESIKLERFIENEESSRARDYFVGILSSKSKNYDLKHYKPLKGAYVCQCCGQLYQEEDSKECLQYQGYTREALDQLSGFELGKLIDGNIGVEDRGIEYVFSQLSKSSLCRKLKSSFLDLSYFEKYLCYLYGCLVRDTRNHIFVFAPFASLKTEEQDFLELLYVIKLLQENGNIFILGNEFFEGRDFFEKVFFLDDSYNVQDKPNSISFREHQQKQKLEIIGLEALSNQKFIPGFYTVNLKDESLNKLGVSELKAHFGKKRKGELLALSLRDNKIFVESSNQESSFLLLRNNLNSVSQVLGLDLFLSEIFSNTRTAQDLSLYFQDFLNPESSHHCCKFCNGRGLFLKELSFGYQSVSLCVHCGGSGYGSEFEKVKFFEYGFRSLLNLNLESFYVEFLINQKIEKQSKILNKFLEFEIGINKLKLGSRLFLLSDVERVALAIFVYLCRAERGSSLVFENFSDKFFLNREELCSYLEHTLSEADLLLIASVYSSLA